MNFSTPVRASPLNISSLLDGFTPNKYTWSRLKAALSVHRKGMGKGNKHTPLNCLFTLSLSFIQPHPIFHFQHFPSLLLCHLSSVLLTPRTLAGSSSPGRANLADLSQDLFATPLRTPLPKHLRSQLRRNDSLV